MELVSEEEVYKGYNIKIHPQEKRGDYEEVFFRVSRGDDSVFTVWVRITETSRGKMGISQDEALKLLQERGLGRIRNMIDGGSFEHGREYRFFEGN